MADSRTRIAFGSKDNIGAALLEKIIDQYDLVCLENGEFGWVDKDGNVVLSQPKTQSTFEVGGNTHEAGKGLDEVVKILSTEISKTSDASPTYFMERRNFPEHGKEGSLYIAIDENIIYRYNATLLMYLPLNNINNGGTANGIEWGTL